MKFSDIVEIYEFDREIRTLLMGILDYVEITYKSLIAYYHTEKYGPMGYEQPDSFQDFETYLNLIIKVTKLKKHYKNNEEIFLKHYVEDKEGKLPLWAVVELINFTDTSKLFAGLHTDMKQNIIRTYLDFSFGSATDYVDNWLRCASILRNIVAHRGRLYNRQLQIKPKLSKNDQQLLLKSKSGTSVLNKLFSYLIAIRNLNRDTNVWINLAYDIYELSLRYPCVSLNDYGFPSDWKKILETKK